MSDRIEMFVNGNLVCIGWAPKTVTKWRIVRVPKWWPKERMREHYQRQLDLRIADSSRRISIAEHWCAVAIKFADQRLDNG